MGRLTLLGSGGAGGGGSTGGAEATAFLARTAGLDTTHTNAYVALIDGLVADGVWSKLDMLHVYATQNSTTALLNLVSTSYNGTMVGTVPFTTDRSFNSVHNSTADYINTGFNAATASSPKFVQNSAHLSVWGVVNTGNSNGSAIGVQASGSNGALIIPQLFNGNNYFRINGSTNFSLTGTGTQGHFVGNRTTSAAVQGYKNAVNIITDNANTSSAVVNFNITVTGDNNGGSVTAGNMQLAMASIGSSLSSTDVTNFYNRLRTYMTVVGVP